MAIVYKVLGQQATAATTETTLYTVPAATSAIASSVTVTNRGTTIATFRVSVAVSGGATTNKDYLYYDVSIAGNDTFIATIGVTLATTDKVKVYASNANLTFQLFGSEIS
jgi:glucose-6-phosphate dehydrogenase assembly protein OpcA